MQFPSVGCQRVQIAVKIALHKFKQLEAVIPPMVDACRRLYLQYNSKEFFLNRKELLFGISLSCSPLDSNRDFPVFTEKCHISPSNVKPEKLNESKEELIN